MGDTDERFEAYCEAVEIARLDAYRGGVSPGLGEIDARFEDLTSGDALDLLRREATEVGRRLLHAVESVVLSARSRAVSTELARREASPVAIGGDARSEAAWRDALSQESAADKRREIQNALDRALTETDELRRERFVRQGEARGELGYETGRARADARHSDVDFDAWIARAERVIEETNPVYHALLRASCQRHRVVGQPHQADLPRVLRMDLFDAQFPAARSFALFDYTIERMRIAAPGLSREVCAPAGNDAACFPIQVPFQVSVALRGPGSVEATRRFFGAMGRALVCAFTSEALPVARRRALDPALVTAWSIVFELLLREPAWIEESPAHQRGEEFAAGLKLRWLLRLRSTAARAQCDDALARLEGASDPHKLAARFADLRHYATGCEHADAGYMRGASAELAAVHELRGMALAAQLLDVLRRQFGSRFWRERSAGDLIKELWHTGGTYDAEALASQVDAGVLDVDVLLQDSV